MFSKKTVFVVGAGASREAGLPTGAELRPIIADKLNMRWDWPEQKSGDRAIAHAITQYAQQTRQDPNSFIEEAWKISEAMPQAISIDNFMDAHAGNEKLQLCGKLAIAQAILEAEGRSSFAFDERRQERFDPSSAENTWYAGFFRLLTENVRLSDLEFIFDNISFIIFNYDGCIEHFLYHSLQNYYRVDAGRAFNLLEAL